MFLGGRFDLFSQRVQVKNAFAWKPELLAKNADPFFNCSLFQQLAKNLLSEYYYHSIH